MEEKYVIGVDFGSDSVRATVVSTVSGREAGSGTAFYPRWKKGLYQHPGQCISGSILWIIWKRLKAV